MHDDIATLSVIIIMITSIFYLCMYIFLYLAPGNSLSVTKPYHL